jgi:hypothetical protein
MSKGRVLLREKNAWEKSKAAEMKHSKCWNVFCLLSRKIVLQRQNIDHPGETIEPYESVRSPRAVFESTGNFRFGGPNKQTSKVFCMFSNKKKKREKSFSWTRVPSLEIGKSGKARAKLKRRKKGHFDRVSYNGYRTKRGLCEG